MGWLIVVGVIALAYPLAWTLLPPDDAPYRRALLGLLTVGLGVGLLTLIILWLGLLGIRFTLANVTGLYLIVIAPFAVFWWRRRPARFGQPRRLLDRQAILIGGLIVLIASGILFNAAYWPFYHEDALGIYADRAHYMFIDRTLVPLRGITFYSYYQAYPMLIPMSYTYAYMASGWENAYLARAIAAALSLGCAGAVWVFARAAYGERPARWSALLLLLTPSFIRWSSSGYVDLPMAFYYTLVAFFLWRLGEGASWRDALLTGLMMGLAAWTKNAALFGAGLFGGWLAWLWLRRSIGRTHVLLAVGGCLLVAAPWYIRNWVEAGLLLPATAWVDQAQPTLTNLLVFITRPENFLISGWLALLGVGMVAWRITQRRPIRGDGLLLWMTLPYLAIWWLLVSYDPRFLLLFMPLLLVPGGQAMDLIWSWLPGLPRRLAWAGLIGLALYGAWISVEFKDEIVRHPFMSSDEKAIIVARSP